MRFIVVVLLSLSLTACGQRQLTPEQVAFLEDQNAAIVETAARGCHQQNNVYPVGAQAWDLAEDFAEAADEVTILLVDLCMTDNIAVAQAAAECDVADAIVLSDFGTYAYRPEFVAGKSSAEMVQLDRCIVEQVQRAQAERA
ncbi:hypothetical protein GW756_03325 [bacterium]|nr:hypothetical protein [bacterium]NCQ55451.1 hypothetical protein [Candidatus Parcubacteria bacterium]NCS67813.1 hypothetical protein [Candidatus Peregrinibacteria bacterium]NCS96373.1 hypothetical protein [bacterium]